MSPSLSEVTGVKGEEAVLQDPRKPESLGGEAVGGEGKRPLDIVNPCDRYHRVAGGKGKLHSLRWPPDQRTLRIRVLDMTITLTAEANMI